MYLELHASSAFSFLEAASLPETLVAQAARYGYPAIALLDRDGVYGAPRFHRAATAAGIKAIIGAELTISPTVARTSRASRPTHPNARTSRTQSQTFGFLSSSSPPKATGISAGSSRA